MSDSSKARDWLSVPGWAAYLACSWTWCIGMFLPVLLVRDFGIGGFIVFAIPNVLGAAGMGWVLRHPESSERLMIRHLAACFWFSRITVAFQFFFVGWMLTRVGFPANALGGVILLIMVLGLSDGLPGPIRAISVATLIVSLVAFRTLWKLNWVDFHVPPSAAAPSLIWLAPVCIFGFALCPYLDMTFHRTRRMLPGAPGTTAFTLGFCVFFAAMILFTLGYRDAIDRLPSGWATPAAITLTAHLFAQLAFTIGVHDVEMEAVRAGIAQRRGHPTPASRRLTRFMLFAALPLLIGGLGMWAPDIRGLAFNEVIYRVFMAFYGLVFPAYVWLCMIPTRDGRAGPTWDKLRVWLFSVGMAAPMFWMGFIERKTWCLGLGLAVVLAARLFLPRSVTSEAPAPRSA